MIMKRAFLIFTATLLLLCFASCGRAEADEPGLEEGYVDNYMYTTIGGVLHRISPYSASVVPVCPDPLCLHSDKSCPFYCVNEASLVTVGKYLYYLKDGGGWGEYAKRLCRFDRESGKYEIVYEPGEGSLLNLKQNGNELYFDLAHTDKQLKNEYEVCRLELKEQRLELLSSERTDNAQSFISEKDGRLYWQCDGTMEYYSTDRAYKDRIEGDRDTSVGEVRGDYLYRMDPMGFYKDTYAYCFRLTATELQSGEETVITEELASTPVLYGNKIIYAKHGGSKYLGLYLYDDEDTPREYYDHCGGKYYICEPDGSNERLLCDLDGTGCEIMWHSSMLVQSGVGDWIAVEAYHFTEPDENGVIERDDNVYLLINILSGEIKVAEIEKRH